MTKHKKTSATIKEPDFSASMLVHVEYNKDLISKMLSGSCTKRLNNFDWLRQEISFSESKTLFFRSAKEQAPYFDHSCTRGLGKAYDFILEQTQNKTELTLNELCNIHYFICNEHNIKINDTFINAGVVRKTNIPFEIESAIKDIFYHYKNDKKHILLRAFDVHYKLIFLQPFDDYNKRTARMAMNWILLENGYRPIAFTRKIDKEQYQAALVDMKNGNTKKYYRYMMMAMYSSQNNIIKQLRTSKIR
jgi:Fic family protein